MGTNDDTSLCFSHCSTSSCDVPQTELLVLQWVEGSDVSSLVPMLLLE
jgi:hypothetical protein